MLESQGKQRTRRRPPPTSVSAKVTGPTLEVVTRAPAVPPDTLNVDDSTLLHVVFGKRWRAVSRDHEGYIVDRKRLRPWSTLHRVGEHPMVIVVP